jgi:hypothetical protein
MLDTKRRGRPANEAVEAIRARNLRWLLAYLMHGLAPIDIAMGESPPVSESTVWRGIRLARTFKSESGRGRLNVPECVTHRHARLVKNGSSRRSSKPTRSEEAD